MLWFLFLCLVGCEPEYGLVEHHVTEQGPEQVTDLFEQSRIYQKLDIVVLVDRSCSMDQQDMQKVGLGIGTLAEDLSATDGPWNLWVTTIDPQYPTIVGETSTTPFQHQDPMSWQYFYQMAESWMLLPRAGSECGFAAIIETPLHLMLRSEAALLWIVVTDEDDHSNGSSYNSNSVVPCEAYEPNEFAIQALSMRPVNKVDGIFIIATNENTGEVGERYMKAAQVMHNLGAQATVKDLQSDWDQWLSDYTFLTKLRSRFQLSQIPRENTIEANVTWEQDNQTQTQELTNFTIDEQYIIFSSPPPPGIVKISYYSQP